MHENSEFQHSLYRAVFSFNYTPSSFRICKSLRIYCLIFQEHMKKSVIWPNSIIDEKIKSGLYFLFLKIFNEFLLINHS